MAHPKVTVLLPCLDEAEFLGPRLESLLAQTFSDWEAVVLDGYSTDGSWEMFQAVASRDPRFRLYQFPPEGLYAALNRGIDLAAGEFLHIATCDDTMSPEFLAALVEALKLSPDAGIAASDLAFVNRSGARLTPEDLLDHLPPESISDLFHLATVPCYVAIKDLNYRPAPHDCLLHFSTKSVYFSLTQLLMRTSAVRANGPFDPTLGSIADFDWLIRLTNENGTVHVPQKIAGWRFHGDQLSVRSDPSKLGSLMRVLQTAAVEVYKQHHALLTPNDCKALLLPIKRYLAHSALKRVRCWLETVYRILRMMVERPHSTVRAIRATSFRPGTVRQTLIPMFMRRLQFFPREIQFSSDPVVGGGNCP